VLSDFLEPFELLRPLPGRTASAHRAADFAPPVVFAGAIASATGQEVTTGCLPAALVRTTLLHRKQPPLKPYDRVRRLRDGAEWRVLAPSADFETPPAARLCLSEVPVERLVRP
jgi:hypothetical protein